MPVPPGMTEADLPPGIVIHRYDPTQEACSMYRGTDGRVGVTQVLGVDEDVVLGRKKWEGDSYEPPQPS
jgi:hypothetical protein